MGFLKKFFKNVVHEGVAQPIDSSFEHLSKDEIETHLGVVRYGKFLLTDAVRPSYDLKVVPKQGYRHDFYHDEESRSSIPVLMISASQPILFELFIDLLEPLGHVADVVLETSHHRRGSGHTDLYREHIDMPVLASTLWDFEDLLTNDGCTGIAVLNPGVPLEVQFDEHKLLIVYGTHLEPFEEILRDHGIACDDQMAFLTEAEHVHSSNDRYTEKFEELQMRLGIDAMVG